MRMCLLEAGPQDLPTSSTLTVLAVMSYAVISVLVAIPAYGFGISMLTGLLDAGMLFAFTWMMLVVCAHRERLNQTVCALAGCGALLGLLWLPLIYSIYEAGDRLPVNPVVRFASIVMMLWMITVFGHIYRQAMSTRLLMGLITGFGFLVLSGVAIEKLFPLPS